mmetsp:Transcript_2594/g.4757  ORF Transcript_2594/g.4757 Transcript_2594/m.4757 type:complete len:227 (-) Transcript_2594:388-1068(-)|eukprot:CAMPEP_0183752894 /NCGR_PEP_ID=MMETSP0739-20130205/2609_1 /TAXON_ID=385413 /ORGANISM="Thalassiosira miniscula, Strain CCMP1093" /LENGTH=226 /DNA_ID=CAMNT_0025989303 /DNA_START=144 /DNA_END=824 /DNA_ORIENTATION=-
MAATTTAATDVGLSPTPDSSAKVTLGARSAQKNNNNKAKATVYIAITLDGYIATSDGSVNFLNKYQSSAWTEDEDMGFSAFMYTVDLLIMGRKTWDHVISFGDEMWPYGDLPIWICSRQHPSEVNIPNSRKEQAKVVGASPPDLLQMARMEGYHHAYVDGATTIREFVRCGCVEEFILTKVPLLLGSGISLFPPSDASNASNALEMIHLTTKSYSNGLVQSHYRVR